MQQKALQLGQGRFRLLLVKQGAGVAEAGPVEAGIDVQRMGQQHLRLGMAALPHQDLGQHLQGRGVVGIGGEQGPQHAFGLLQPSGEQGLGGGLQARVAHGGAAVLGIGQGRA